MSEEIELKTNEMKNISSVFNKNKFKSMPRKTRIKVLLKILIIIICVSSLIYYSTLLIHQYTRGQTVVNVKIETQKNNQKIPAFTLCYPQLLSMRKIAEKYSQLGPTYSSYLSNIQNSSELSPDPESNWTRFKKVISTNKPTVTEMFNLSIPWEEEKEGLNTHYPVLITVYGYHHFRNGTSLESQINDTSPVESVALEQKGRMKKCFTFFSHLKEVWRDYHMEIKWIQIIAYPLVKHMSKSYYMENSIRFSMHSPNTFPQLLNINEFVELNANHTIKMTYNRWKTKLLGHNYQTNCMKYNIDDNEYFRFRSDCINHCIQQKLNDCSLRKSLEKNSTYRECLFPTDALWRRPAFNLYRDIKLCRFWEQFTSFECLFYSMGQIENQCIDRCRPDCVKRYYFTDIRSSRENKKGLMRLTIVHDQYPDQVTEHLPEMTFISFASNFGGLLGMWLGLSALALLKYILKLF